MRALLTNATDITILAPNNDAFTTFLNSSDGQNIANDPTQVAALLSYHIINGTYYDSNFTDSPTFVQTSLNSTSYSNVSGGQRLQAVNNGSTVNLFSGLLTQSNIVSAVCFLCYLPPSYLSRLILTFTQNLNFSGGTIHIIDKVLTLPGTPSDTAAAMNLTSLAGAMQQTNLTDTLNDLQDITIFAPTNDAFQSVGSVFDSFSNQQLAGILEYHVVSGAVDYSTLLSNTTLPTVGGQRLTVRMKDGDVFINEAKVVTSNVLVGNGVVHVIDAYVLLSLHVLLAHAPDPEHL